MNQFSRLTVVFLALSTIVRAGELSGTVVDAGTRTPLAARIYLQDSAGKWLHVQAVKGGKAVAYAKARDKSVEIHTTVSDHGFSVDLAPGSYTLTVERGKEYRTAVQRLEIGESAHQITVPIQRWINMAERGWYSGETHVHRSIEELPLLVIAEDLNASFPLTYWVTQAFQPPQTSAKTANTRLDTGKPIIVDREHWIYPRNTEYEIFSVNRQRHTLGAVFILNHRKVFPSGVPPVGAIARQAHQQGALLELDKHNWPWSMAIIPIMKVDLFELTNNHVWRTGFFFKRFGETPPAFMKVESDSNGMTELGWLDFGFKNYYALLNCGFRLRPTAGTASGVHPVPLGFGRVYVQLPGGFLGDDWLEGLDRGRSFVTTGPMIFSTVNGQPPGATIKRSMAGKVRVKCSVESINVIERLELIRNGDPVATAITMEKNSHQKAELDCEIDIEQTSWLAFRAFTKLPDGRTRFAHTAPVFVEVAGSELVPRKQEAEYLVDRVREQIARSSDVLPAEAIQEYREALKIYQAIARKAR